MADGSAGSESGRQRRATASGRDPTRCNPPPRAEHSRADRFDRRRILIGVGVALVTFAVFTPALRNDFVDWDDTDNFVLNEHYRGLNPARLRWMFTTTHMGHYQPLSWVTLAGDYLWGRALFGDGLDPWSYHLTNCVLHAVSAALVYLLALELLAAAAVNDRARPTAARRATRPDGASAAAPPARLYVAAALAALLFALHPLRVESVAWATERRDVLSSFFLLLTVLLYVRAPVYPAARRWKWLAGVGVLFVLSLLSRALGVVLPVILLLLDWYPLRRFEDTDRAGAWPAIRGVLLEKAVLLVPAVVVAAMAVTAQAATGAAGGLQSHGPLPRLVQACYGLVFYVGKTCVPHGLSPIYELKLPLDIFAARYMMAVGLVLAGAVGLALLVRAGRGRGVAVAAGAYALVVLPVSGLVQSGMQEVADRYSYLPDAVLMILLTGGAVRLRAIAGAPRIVRRGLAGGAIAAGLVLAVLTWRQCGVWRNSATLFAHAVRVQPDSSNAQNGYGAVLLREKRYDEALQHLERAIEIRPGHLVAHRNIWRAWAEQGRPEQVLAAVRHTLQLVPDFPDAYYELGWWLSRAAEEDAAIAAYQEAVVLRPGYSAAHTNLAVLYKKHGRTSEALEHFAAGALADRRNLYAWRGWAALLHDLGRNGEALDVLGAALQIDPQNALTQQYWREWTDTSPTTRP